MSSSTKALFAFFSQLWAIISITYDKAYTDQHVSQSQQSSDQGDEEIAADMIL